ncbi:cell cycle checkpoint control protein Rad9 [Megachile rotundata]|uniref:cell cycle checkpoint control protein Rad9 n=1 Tax=Megachile rotundata TaxID=143995 RepID=UPI003FD0F91D
MKCVVPGTNVKILAKAIHTLARIGDEMYIEPQKDAISFRTVNMANSAYADFTFSQDYFSYYMYGDLQESDALKCKISMRSAMTVFKSPNTMDRQIETCHIKLEPDASEILFILKYKNSINKTHLLPILDCEVLQTAYDKDCATNKLLTQARVLGDALHNFHQQLMEITLEVSAQKLLLRNYVDDTSGLSNTTRTQLALGKGEFDRYDINSETSITFCMKEFKSLLTFAELVGVPIGTYFEGAGRPVIFALKNPSFEANLVLSTVSADTDSQTETTLDGKQEKSVNRRVENKRTSRKTNKSRSRIDNKTAKSNKTLGNSALNNTNQCFVDKSKKTNQNTSKEQPSLLVSKSTTDNENEVNGLSVRQNAHRESQICSSSSYDTSKKSISGKKLVNSIFSSITKRKSISDESDKQQMQNNSDTLKDAIPNSPSPPNKKARLIFQKCFQTTFDPQTLPGFDVILAEDSDECCE